MNTKIELKSAMLGLVLGVIATVAIGAASSAGQVGRYQIAGTANNGIVLDTVTGRVWSAFLSSGRADQDFFQPKNVEKE